MQEHEEEDKKLKKEKAKIEKGTQPTEITEKKEKLPPRESMELCLSSLSSLLLPALQTYRCRSPPYQ